MDIWAPYRLLDETLGKLWRIEHILPPSLSNICSNVLKDFIRLCLTHCSLITSYGDINMGQYCLRLWLVAWRHQDITWTNFDLSSKAESNFTRCRMILLYFWNRNSDNILWTIKLYIPPQMHSAKLWLVSPGQNGRHFTDDIFNEKLCIFIRVSPKFVPKDPIDN